MGVQARPATLKQLTRRDRKTPVLTVGLRALARIAHRASFRAANLPNLGRPEGRPCTRPGLVPVEVLEPGFPALPARTTDTSNRRGCLRRGPRTGPKPIPYLGRAAVAPPPPCPRVSRPTKAVTASTTRPNTARKGQPALSRNTTRRALVTTTAGTFHSRCRNVLTSA